MPGDVLLGIWSNECPLFRPEEVFHIAEAREAVKEQFPHIQYLFRVVKADITALNE